MTKSFVGRETFLYVAAVACQAVLVYGMCHSALLVATKKMQSFANFEVQLYFLQSHEIVSFFILIFAAEDGTRLHVSHLLHTGELRLDSCVPVVPTSHFRKRHDILGCVYILSPFHSLSVAAISPPFGRHML